MSNYEQLPAQQPEFEILPEIEEWPYARLVSRYPALADPRTSHEQVDGEGLDQAAAEQGGDAPTSSPEGELHG